MASDPLRDHLIRLLAWHDAHIDFDGAIDGIPESKRGQAPVGLPYSPWQLLEHMRRTQRDILEFCQNRDYVEPSWPDDYWPASVAPESARAWDDSVAGFRADREALQALAADRSLDLAAPIPRRSGQTYLRELLLVADHNAYHIGQLVAVRRCLGIWPAA